MCTTLTLTQHTAWLTQANNSMSKNQGVLSEAECVYMVCVYLSMLSSCWPQCRGGSEQQETPELLTANSSNTWGQHRVGVNMAYVCVYACVEVQVCVCVPYRVLVVGGDQGGAVPLHAQLRLVSKAFWELLSEGPTQHGTDLHTHTHTNMATHPSPK